MTGSQKKKCKHYPMIGLDNTLKSLPTQPFYYVKQCVVCKKKFYLKRYRGKLYHYDLKRKSRLDYERDLHRKELLQPLDSKGRINEDFTRAYGYNPFEEPAPQLKSKQREQRKDKIEERINEEKLKKVEEKVLKEIKPFKEKK